MLGIIIVAYKSPKLTIDFIKREMANIDVPWVCCVVNNAATEEETQSIAGATGGEIVNSITSEIPLDKKIYILPSSENLGFARGNNYGVKFLTIHFDVDHLLFTNNDIEIKDSTCVSTLIRILDGNKEIGAIGPRIIGLDGKDQLPHDKPVSIYRQIGWNLLPFIRRKHKTDNNAASQIRESGFTYWVQGSFFVMRTEDFLKVDMFDPNTFLYAEEQILAEKLKRIDKYMYYENSVKVLHYEGGTIVRKHGTKASYRMGMESNCYYYRKYLHINKFLVWVYKYSFLCNQKMNRQ